MEEHAVQTARTARYYTLGPGPVREVWLVAHGYGQLAARFLRHFEAIAAGGRLVVAPEGLSRFYLEDGSGRPAGGRHERVGASWMTREAREGEIADQGRYLDAVCAQACARAGADPLAVALVALGFSQGTATVARWLARSPLVAAREDAGRSRADRLVLWGGALPADLDLEAHGAWLARTELVLVAGDRDEFATPGRVVQEERRLGAAGLPYRVVGFAGGHRLNERVLRDLAAAPLSGEGPDGDG